MNKLGINALSSKQRDLYISASSRSKENSVLVVDGGIRTGKTKFGTWGFIEYIINSEPGSKFAVLSWTTTAAKRNVGEYIDEYCKLRGIKYKFNASENFYTFSNNKKLYLFGASTSVSFNAFQGITLKGVLADEAPLFSIVNIRKIFDRTVSYHNDRKIILTSNPSGSKAHPYYKTYIEHGIYKTFSFNMLDNPILNIDDVMQYKRTSTATQFQKEILGEWVITEGACYPRPPRTITANELESIKMDYYRVGSDEALANDAKTMYLVGYSKENNAYYVIDKYRNDTPNESIKVIEKEAREALNGWAKKYGNITAYFETNPGVLFNIFTYDRTLDSRVKVKKVSKSKVATKSKSAIQERVDIVNIMIAGDMLYINEECSELLEGFDTAVYNKSGDRLDDGTSNIDDLDAFEYAIKKDFKYIYKDYYSYLDNKLKDGKED